MKVAALIVNPSDSFADEFEKKCPAVFGVAPACTWYDRPFDDGHPRLRPENDPFFQLVVVDLDGWASPHEATELVEFELPGWTSEVMRFAAKRACVIILCPDAALAAVTRLVESLKIEPGPFVCPRNLGQLFQKDITHIIFETWELWRSNRESSPFGSGGGSPPPTSPGGGNGAASSTAAPATSGYLSYLIRMLSRR